MRHMRLIPKMRLYRSAIEFLTPRALLATREQPSWDVIRRLRRRGFQLFLELLVLHDLVFQVRAFGLEASDPFLKVFGLTSTTEMARFKQLRLVSCNIRTLAR